jgi:PAS domain S-box-containing protein
MNTDLNHPLNSIAAVGIIFQLADGCIQSCNQEAERILGYAAKQLTEANYFEPPWQTIHRDGSVFSVETHPGIISLRTGQPSFGVQMGFYKPDGNLVWLLISTQPLFQANSSQAYAVVISFTDITENLREKTTITTLETSQASGQFTILFVEDNPEDRVMYRRYLQKDHKNQYIFLEAESGESALELTQKYQPDLILLDYLLPDMDGLEWLNLWQKQRSENRPPVIVLTGQGDENVVIQFLKLGAVNYLVKNQLTSEKLNLEVTQAIAEHQLRTQHQETLVKLQLATVASGLGMWFWDLINDKLEWTEQCSLLFGLNPNTEMSYQLFLNTLHPEDRDRTDTAVKQALINKTEYNIEYRVIWSDGSLHWISAKGKGFYNQDGTAVRMMGTAQDISEQQAALRERKQIEQSLIDSNQRITNILESMTDAFYTLDRDFKFTYLNQEAQRVLFKSQEQLLGNSIWLEFNPVVGTELESQFRRALAEQVATRFEYYYPSFARWYEISVYPSTHGLSVYFRNITERKQIEEALRNSEYRVRTILDSLIIFAGIITTDGEVIEVNQVALNSVSLQPEDILHKKFCETYWWSYSSEIKAQLEDAIQRAAKGESVRFDIVGRVRDNKFILIDFSIVPVFNADGQIEYLIPSGIDVSDREASKLALQQREDELRLITEVIPQQIWTASPTGKTEYINQPWQEYTGLSLEQIKAKGWLTIVHPDDLAQVIQAWMNSIQTGKKYEREARLRGQDGTYRWFLGRARPLHNKEEKIIQWYGTNTDITPIKELEEKLRQQTKDLTEANRLKDEFLAIVSHELRTPLNPILGWSQLLATGRLDPDKTAQGIETIQRNAKLQAQLIDDLLDVSRILRGKLELKITAINLESIIRSAIATVQLAAEAKSIQILTEFNPNVGQISGDPGRLQQIVWNLLSNGIKFTPEGGQVTIKLKRVGTKAEIQVQDTGQGISAEFLPYVFDRFRQAENATTRKFGGLGLGLAIVRHLTEIHKGTVAVSSPGEGQGATFSVKLPLLSTLTLNQPDSNLVNELVTSDRFEGMRVLVVEDEIDSRDILTFVLEQEGAEVISTDSANAALEALQQSIPDLIISDIGMPAMDGYTLMTKIRELPQGKNLPAIALTAYAGEVDQQRSINAGFHKHLSKPINIPELLETITEVLI